MFPHTSLRSTLPSVNREHGHTCNSCAYRRNTRADRDCDLHTTQSSVHTHTYRLVVGNTLTASQFPQPINVAVWPNVQLDVQSLNLTPSTIAMYTSYDAVTPFRPLLSRDFIQRNSSRQWYSRVPAAAQHSISFESRWCSGCEPCRHPSPSPLSNFPVSFPGSCVGNDGICSKHSRPRTSTRWSHPHLGTSLSLAPSNQFRTETIFRPTCDGDPIWTCSGQTRSSIFQTLSPQLALTS